MDHLVHYVLEAAAGLGQHRPAMIVGANEDGTVNLAVFTDYKNDNPRYPALVRYVDNVPQDLDEQKAGTFHPSDGVDLKAPPAPVADEPAEEPKPEVPADESGEKPAVEPASTGNPPAEGIQTSDTVPADAGAGH